MRDVFLLILVIVAACVPGTVRLHVRYARLGEPEARLQLQLRELSE